MYTYKCFNLKLFQSKYHPLQKWEWTAAFNRKLKFLIFYIMQCYKQPHVSIGTWKMQLLSEVYCKSHFLAWKWELLPNPIRLPPHVLRLTFDSLCSGLILQCWGWTLLPEQVSLCLVVGPWSHQVKGVSTPFLINASFIWPISFVCLSVR